MSTQALTSLAETNNGDTVVTCPSCKGKSVYGPLNEFRPFCSARCQQLDFGAWASENYTVPSITPSIDTKLD